MDEIQFSCPLYAHAIEMAPNHSGINYHVYGHVAAHVRYYNTYGFKVKLKHGTLQYVTFSSSPILSLQIFTKLKFLEADRQKWKELVDNLCSLKSNNGLYYYIYQTLQFILLLPLTFYSTRF
jgi:hypothetical protein